MQNPPKLFRTESAQALNNKRHHPAQPRILLVEDDADIARLVQLHLQELNAEVIHTARGDEALHLAEQQSWDLLILDIRLPGVNGLDICRALRERSDYIPILMLTSKSSELDRVLGLELGADDYVTKPFSAMELMARVKAILRRMSQLHNGADNDPEPETLHFDNLEINIKNHTVAVNQQLIELTSKEFELLVHFARHPDRVFRRAELLDKVWGYGHDGYEHTVNSHINRLRAKIEQNPSAPTRIITIWGVGYKFQSGQPQSA